MSTSWSKAGPRSERTLSGLWTCRGAAAVPAKIARHFISGLGHYYYHRQNQTERYPETYGQLGADYIAKQWSTTDDQRIDRLTQDAYARGYLKPADFEAVAGKMVATVVKNERVTGKACAG